MFDLEKTLDAVYRLFKPQPLDHTVEGRHYKVLPTEYGLEIQGQIVPPAAPVVSLTSLSGFIDAYGAGVDGFSAEETAVHVVDHLTVQLVSLRADEYGRRKVYLQAVCDEVNPFPFDSYLQPETFLLKLESGFRPTDNVIALQKLASSLSSESSIKTQDNGLTQTIEIRQGAASHTEVPLPRRIPLLAYRTFREIDPVQSEFLVRLKAEPNKLPTIALLQVDADKWKHDTALVVKHWLVSQLPEKTVVIA
ncbi:hypothetical protein SAMN05421819_3539 [Bryocella elongata]|uniref:TIGR04255 family protein n=1 Tax=Bryocella elongata TaxID=863522 RepID=A0A1H6B5A0_9BACT|nr:hypothetical protein [Bryocella elongata]SEG56023.1 hypothetical protein SAMN05421819_3539 [Bryocella elongata]